MDLSIIRWEGRIDFQFEDWPSDFVTLVFKDALTSPDADGALKCAATYDAKIPTRPVSPRKVRTKFKRKNTG